jgi:hypothetical protein
MLLYESDYLTIKWDDTIKGAIVKRVGFAVSEKFRFHNLKLIEIFRERKITQFISDVTEMKVISQEDQNWFSEEFFPQLYRSGLRYMVVIPPVSAIAKLSVGEVERIATRAGIEVKIVSDYEEAANWLRSKKLF